MGHAVQQALFTEKPPLAQPTAKILSGKHVGCVGLTDVDGGSSDDPRLHRTHEPM